MQSDQGISLLISDLTCGVAEKVLSPLEAQFLEFFPKNVAQRGETVHSFSKQNHSQCLCFNYTVLGKLI